MPHARLPRFALVLAAVALLATALGVSTGAGSAPDRAAAADLVAGDGGSASASAVAQRLSRIGKVFFPLNPLPRCYFLDNFGDPRSGGRTHQGDDILAALGSEIYAATDGILNRQAIDGQAGTSLQGNSWTLTAPDGMFTFYAHLSAFAPGLSVGSHVVVGQLIGYVGDTGDAGPGNYHLHFEIHPDGGAAVNPLPWLTVPPNCPII